MKILMVCLGNICRSPMAEGILKSKILARGVDWTVDSAGTESFHVHEPPHPFAVKTAALHGIDISMLRARKFTPGDFQHFDRIYALATDVYGEISHIGGAASPMDKVELLLNELYPGRNRSVPDPWNGPLHGFQEVFDLLEKACEMVMVRYADQAASFASIPRTKS
ncbi:MAG TPA: low molecular weight protein-tyrosine-phosphatase [Chitinophagaceae bacterium]|nr:low molecular weight protein-tyrosine-phosphatase [Chitinophagaceae bacterium]